MEGDPEAVGPVEGLEYVAEEPLEPDAVAGAVGPPEPEVAGLEREEDGLFEVVGLRRLALRRRRRRP